jgi:predicted thioesterase
LTVRAEATVTAVEGRKIKFNVVAFDDKEKIGEGIINHSYISFFRNPRKISFEQRKIRIKSSRERQKAIIFL